MTLLLYGLSVPDASARIGHLGQVARLDAFTECNGPACGARRIRLVTGGGLELEIHPDRALDLGQMTVHGIPLAWMSPTGISHPGLYDPHGENFLRTFGGGLLATCGLDHFGPPSKDGGAVFPMHGRVGGLPATLMRTDIDKNELIVEGVVRQAAVHREDIELHRTIRATIGSTSVTVVDTVTNKGCADQPHMILYHCNFGWPLLSEDAEVIISSTDVIPNSPEAETDAWNHLAPPTPGYRERVYLHMLDKGRARLSLRNSQLGIEMKMSFDTAVLPALCQWKMLGERLYVLGLEPTNVPHLAGRGSARATGMLPMLAPRESVTYELTFDVMRTDQSQELAMAVSGRG